MLKSSLSVTKMIQFFYYKVDKKMIYTVHKRTTFPDL